MQNLFSESRKVLFWLYLVYGSRLAMYSCVVCAFSDRQVYGTHCKGAVGGCMIWSVMCMTVLLNIQLPFISPNYGKNNLCCYRRSYEMIYHSLQLAVLGNQRNVLKL